MQDRWNKEGYISTSTLALGRGLHISDYVYVAELPSPKHTFALKLPPKNGSWSALFPGPRWPLSTKVQYADK